MDTVKSPFARVCLQIPQNVSAPSNKHDRPVSSSAVPLRVVRLVAQIGVQEFVAFRLGGILARRLERNDHRINFAPALGVVILTHPTPLRLVVCIENAQTLDGPAGPLLLPPDSI